MSNVTKATDWLQPEKLLLLEAWARDGLFDDQIAKNMGVSEATLYNYKRKHPEIANAFKKGKEVVDIEVENALFKKALGYNAVVMKAFKLKDIIYENGKKVSETERIEYAEEEVHIPADTTAQIFWLKNRKRLQWRDKVEYSSDSGEISKLDELLKEIKKDATE